MPQAKGCPSEAPVETPREAGNEGMSMCGQPRPSPVFVATAACAAEVENMSRTATLQLEREVARDPAGTTTEAGMVDEQKNSNLEGENAKDGKGGEKVAQSEVEIVENDQDKGCVTQLALDAQRVDATTEVDDRLCKTPDSACTEPPDMVNDPGISRRLSTKIQETLNAVRSTLSQNYENFTRTGSERSAELSVVQQIENAVLSAFDKCTEVGESTMPCVFGRDFAEDEETTCPKPLIRMIVDTPAGPYVRFIPDALLQDAIDMGFVSQEEVSRQRREWQEKYGLIPVQGSFAESLVASN